MRGNGKNGDARALAIEQSVDEMQIAGSAASRTNGKVAGKMSLGAGRESGNLFVTHVEPLDFALASNRIGEAVQAIADDSVYPFNSGDREGFGKLIRNSFHVLLHLVGSTGTARQTKRESASRLSRAFAA
jgi:hypothetical protein